MELLWLYFDIYDPRKHRSGNGSPQTFRHHVKPSSMARILPPLQPPEHPSNPPADRLVLFRHPAYPDTEPDLLCLAATDGDDLGVDYGTAFVAFCIVTGNSWHDGWVAEKGDAGDFALSKTQYRTTSTIILTPSIMMKMCI